MVEESGQRMCCDGGLDTTRWERAGLAIQYFYRSQQGHRGNVAIRLLLFVVKTGNQSYPILASFQQKKVK